MAITLYPADCSDFSTNGLGALTPLSCTVSEEAGGMFELELKHPIDNTLRWAQLAPGCIIKAPIPTRESPLYEEVEDVWGEAPVTVTRNVWQVSGTTVGLYMRSGPGTKYKNYGYLKNGAKVNEIGRQTVSGRVWVHVIVQKGGRNCWMSTKWLRRVGTVTETLSQGKVIGQRTVSYEQSRDQLFRIHTVERDAKERIVTVKAMHIFYDLRGNLVNRAYEAKKVEAKDALTAAFGALAAPTGFELHVAAGVSGKVDGDYGWKNPVECMLDPDEGILPQAKATLVRDNFDVFVLPDFTRDSGVTIRRGKNLVGVTVTRDASDIVTRIIPCGKNKKGEDLFLSGTNYVDSPHINDYPIPYVKKIDYDAKTVDKDADNETTFKNDTATRAKLLALAEADFSENGVDLPGVGMEVDFVLLQNTAEYADYASLQAVFLNDTVTVIDSLIGLTTKLRVTGYDWNAITCQYEKLTLGDLESIEQTVYSYNLPTGGVSGSKLVAGSVPGAALRDATIEYAKIAVAAIEQLTAESVTALTAHIQEIVSQQITTDELYAALATLNRVVIEHADIQWADIESLQAAVAAITKASIGTADIGWGQIKDLITGTAIITEGEAGQLFISRLAVTEANMVSLTTGELVVKGKDGHFYSVSVNEQGEVTATLKQVSNDDVTDLSIDAGEKLIEGSVTAACLNATDIFADSAVIRKMIAANLDVDELFAREAFITLLRTSHIVGDKTLEIVVRDTEAAQKAANAAIKSVDVEYYLSDSPTELSGGSWSTVAPEWVDGKYMWSRTTTYPNDGEPVHSEPTCIAGATGATGPAGAPGKDGAQGPKGDPGQDGKDGAAGTNGKDGAQGPKGDPGQDGAPGKDGAKGDTGATGKGVSAIVEEYYLSTSNTTQTGGSWSTSQPAWVDGCFLWTRSRITWTDGNTTTTAPVLADAINSANNVKVGGRNLIRNTATPTTLALRDTGAPEDNYNYANYMFTVGTLTMGETYTLSADIQVTAGAFDRVSCIIYDLKNTSAQANYLNATIQDGKIRATFTITGSKAEHLLIYAGPSGSTRGNGMVISNLKFERGNKPTDWSPAPEDVDEQIDSTAESLSGQIGDVSSRVDDCVTHSEQAVYLRQVAGKGVYVGFEGNSAQAFIDASGWFRVLQNGVSISALGPRIQELGTLTIYETADGGHGFI